jgi:hypothetical protein
MTPLADAPSGAANEPSLPRRDWILLPALAILTIAALVSITHFVARRLFSASMNSSACLILNDPATGVRGVPNSVCWEKVPEDELVEYRFDNCGYRSAMRCGPKAPGTFRIVMTGSSVAIGERVPVEKTFAALLPTLLQERTGRHVELYNEGMAYGFPRSTALRFNDVLAQQPDLILWVLTPTDIGEGEIVLAEDATPHSSETSKISKILSKLREAITTNSIGDRLRNHVELSLTGIMLQHAFYKYESQDQYIKSYLMGSDRVTGFLKSDMSALWKSHIEEFDRRVGEIAERASAAGATLVVVFLPNRPQAAMISRGDWPAGYDPYKLDHELAASVQTHGGIFVDILPGFRSIPRPEQYYLPVDGHPMAAAHAIFSKLLAEGLTGGAVPALDVPARNSVAVASGR